MKTQKNNKGITLIALVITIIIMLILVMVTIYLAVDGGLFDYSKRASQETNDAYIQEQELSSGMVNVGNVRYETVNEYMVEILQ